MSELSGCAKCVKYLLFIFNLLFLLAGLALIAIGAYAYVQTSSSGLITSGPGAAIFLIVIGCIVFLISFFGCAGAINNNHCMVVTFGVLLLIILLLQIAAVVTGFVLKDKLTMALDKEMSESQVEYDNDEFIAKTWNDTQAKLKCCGTTGFRTWNVSAKLSDSHSVPDSCCQNMTFGCGYGKNEPQYASELWESGCTTTIKTLLDSNLFLVAIAAAVVAVLEILGIVFAFSLAHSLRKDYRVV